MRQVQHPMARTEQARACLRLMPDEPHSRASDQPSSRQGGAPMIKLRRAAITVLAIVGYFVLLVANAPPAW